ncbi:IMMUNOGLOBULIN-BINDING PROTEIN 1 [Salix koriyanagi]|uniref:IMMUNOGLOBULIN-BINDING PROTEIN 1 n=1 Tax=Salix koriyanagi TaxID=2511006 RepID=A0A9Q0WD48_9ROSI|nr:IMMUNOGLOBULIN-BINDING PROTEIN 1 [Salix koriyanagi]
MCSLLVDVEQYHLLTKFPRHVPPSLFDQASKIHVKVTESGSNDQELEDISTTNLKCILVPFYLAELAEKILQDDRIQILKASQTNLKEFISFCEAMELVPEEEALKIARYKHQRAAEAKLEEIKERKERRSRSTKASAVSTPVETGEEDMLDDDGEEEREYSFCGGLDYYHLFNYLQGYQSTGNV